MKIIYLFLSIAFLAGCSKGNQEIFVNPELIDSMYRNEHLNPDNPDFRFIDVKSYEIDLNGNNKADTIHLRSIKGWNDPGDFIQIEIVLDNSESFLETNFEGWVEFNKNYQVPIEIQENNLIDSDLIVVTDLTENQRVVMAFGWTYASIPGRLSVFEANALVPKMIFNQNFEIHEIGNGYFSGTYHEEKKYIQLSENVLKRTTGPNNR